ncbi:MAG: hypothetical protein U0X73_14865 [Thermoanaerobaculia bacterium]
MKSTSSRNRAPQPPETGLGAGVADRETVEALLVEIGGFRPRRRGPAPPASADDPIERRLMRELAEPDATSDSGARYAALLRRLTRR